MSDDLIDRARAAIKHAKRLGVPSPLLSDMADEIARLRSEMASGSFYQEKDIDAMQDEIVRLRAEVERLREAERTAWERGLNAAASHVRCETAKWLTPEDRATPSGKMAGEYLDALSDEIAALTPASDGRADALLAEAVEIGRKTLREIAGMDLMGASAVAWNAAREIDAILARAAELEKADGQA